MPDLDLRFIGTGNAFAPGGLCWNGFLLDGRFLFEAPPQALQSLNRMGIDANDLDAVVLSHHHGDHFLGLPFLFLQWKYGKRTRPIRIIGPAGTKDITLDIGRQVYPGLLDTTFEVEWDEVRGGGRTGASGLDIEAVDVQHDRRLSGTHGYSLSLDGRRIAYTGDSALCDSVLDLARTSEALVSECASVDEVVDVHMNLRDDMPRVRAAMKPGAPLILTHLGPGVTTGGLADTIVAEDFGAYRI